MDFTFLKFSLIVLSNLLQAAILFTFAFYFVICLFTFAKSRKYTGDGKLRRFAVLLPAYNEENTIRLAIESLLRLEYPRDRFDVYVVADHCTDKTVELARAAGVTVLEHAGPGLTAGKGRALKWACARILALGRHDALCYFDSDSLAHPGFLKAMNAALGCGHTALQARSLAKNTRSWLPKTLASMDIVNYYMYEKPKHFLGLSAKLRGKGMCFSKELSEKYPWDETSVTEDLDLQSRLISGGVRIALVPEAIVYDEEPVAVEQQVRRTLRWERGRSDNARRNLAALLRRAVLKADLKALESALSVVIPYRMPAAALAAALIFFTRDSFNLLVWLFNRGAYSGLTLALAGFALLTACNALALRRERAPLAMYAAFFLRPSIYFLHLYVIVKGLFHTQKDWGRTEHTSQVAISDLVKNERV
jgi:cellulose synthase/poly-beta-1,6-N-acetylglucosamine synthase-like glycosyltransferase